MSKNKADLQTRLYASCIIILLAGLSCALVIYLTADDAPGSAVRYELVNGAVYPVSPGDSKAYVRELRRFGGKAAVLFDEFNRWFAALWQGKSLAITVAWLSIFVSLGVFLFANTLPSDSISDVRGEEKRD